MSFAQRVGLPLFSTLSKPMDQQLVSSQAFDSSAVAQIYRSARSAIAHSS